MPSPQLDPVETRILGCLMEKERLTPENYPMSLNGLTAACNQSTNRDPVVGFDSRTVEAGVHALREKKLATLIHEAGARVQKYKHNLPDQYDLSLAEMALLCVLLLRGPQTPGELRLRTERIYGFKSIEEVEAALDGLAKGSDPIVKVLPARAGQKERRYLQLLSPEPAPASDYAASAPAPAAPRSEAGEKAAALAEEVAALRAELQQLREEFTIFRKQFE
jgi:uncharacterized protein YceH (UPF0502 family)